MLMIDHEASSTELLAKKRQKLDSASYETRKGNLAPIFQVFLVEGSRDHKGSHNAYLHMG